MIQNFYNEKYTQLSLHKFHLLRPNSYSLKKTQKIFKNWNMKKKWHL